MMEEGCDVAGSESDHSDEEDVSDSNVEDVTDREEEDVSSASCQSD